MIARYTALLAATALALTACARSPRAVPENQGPAGPRFTATLSTPAYDTVTSSAALRAIMATPITGTATVTPAGDGNAFAASISIAGAQPGTVYPWYVHIGDCSNQRGVVGELQMYPPITAGPDGTGKATATIPFPLPRNAAWSVSVFPSQTQLETVIACGNLKRA